MKIETRYTETQEEKEKKEREYKEQALNDAIKWLVKKGAGRNMVVYNDL